MNPDAILWLNQAREELRQLALSVERATSPRRKDDLPHALASLRRAGELAAFADTCILRAKEGVRYAAQPATLNSQSPC